MSKTLSLVLLSLLTLPGVAFAQGKPAPEPEAAGDEVELGEGVADDATADEDFSSSSGATYGADENPDAPDSVFNKKDEGPIGKTKASKVQSGYPARVLDRPLNLPGGMSQVAFSVPGAFDPVAIAATIDGDYGITREVQVGLRYGLGRYADSFATGKAVAIDAQYLFADFVAGQVSIPMYLDPFAIGVVLGAPMKFTFFDSFSLVLGQDLVSIKLHEFLPSIDNATQNDAFIAQREVGQIVPLWIGNLTGGAIYQLDAKSALDLQLGTTFDDTIAAARAVMNLGYLYANTNKLDFGARLAISDLSQFTESLALSLFVNLRI